MIEDNKKYDLEERLIQFALLIIDIVEMLPNTRAGNHIAGQLICSGTSPAFNYTRSHALRGNATSDALRQDYEKSI